MWWDAPVSRTILSRSFCLFFLFIGHFDREVNIQSLLVLMFHRVTCKICNCLDEFAVVFGTQKIVISLQDEGSFPFTKHMLDGMLAVTN